MADALDSKSSAFTGVRVQLPPPAPAKKSYQPLFALFPERIPFRFSLENVIATSVAKRVRWRVRRSPGEERLVIGRMWVRHYPIRTIGKTASYMGTFF